jgi:hypothetical protein
MNLTKYRRSLTADKAEHKNLSSDLKKNRKNLTSD